GRLSTVAGPWAGSTWMHRYTPSSIGGCLSTRSRQCFARSPLAKSTAQGEAPRTRNHRSYPMGRCDSSLWSATSWWARRRSCHRRARTAQRWGQMPVRLLVVEDDERVMAALSTSLRRHGFEVLCSRSGAGALALLRHRPDVILLDLGLPDHDGFHVCEWI